VGFLGGCTQKKTTGFFGYVPGCLNLALWSSMSLDWWQTATKSLCSEWTFSVMCCTTVVYVKG